MSIPGSRKIPYVIWYLRLPGLYQYIHVEPTQQYDKPHFMTRAQKHFDVVCIERLFEDTRVRNDLPVVNWSTMPNPSPMCRQKHKSTTHLLRRDMHGENLLDTDAHAYMSGLVISLVVDWQSWWYQNQISSHLYADPPLQPRLKNGNNNINNINNNNNNKTKKLRSTSEVVFFSSVLTVPEFFSFPHLEFLLVPVQAVLQV